MSAFCEMLLVTRRKKGRKFRGALRAAKRYASHNVYMAKPSRGRFAIPRAFVAYASHLVEVQEKTRKFSLTSNSAFRLEVIRNFSLGNVENSVEKFLKKSLKKCCILKKSCIFAMSKQTTMKTSLIQEIQEAKLHIKKMMERTKGKAFEDTKEIMAKLLDIEWENDNNPNYNE